MANTHNVGISYLRMGDYLRKHWGWFMALGIILSILGLLALGFTITATIVSVLAFGILLFSAGIMQVAEGVKTRKWSGFFIHLLIGIFYLVAGVILFFNPGMGAITLTLVLGTFYISIGLIRMVSSASIRYRQWKWTFFSGIIATLVGIFIAMSWPVSGLFIIGIFVGIDLLFYGINLIALAVAARNTAEEQPMADA